MKLTVSNQERLKLMRTLRWVLAATMMDVHETSMLEDIVRRLASLEKPPPPPKINT